MRLCARYGVFEMHYNASSDSCSRDVLIDLSQPRGLRRAPVTGAAVSGVSLALAAAALIYVCHRKLLFFTAPCGGERRRLEECVEESDGDSESGRTHTRTDEGEQWTLSRDVAAFALKARVVYPISQRYRPLADGSSNPSLHEPSKRTAPPSQDSASSLGDDWLSQVRGDDESCQFVSCGPSSKTHASHMFRRVEHYPQTPCYSRVSLLCLTLEELRRQTSRLQQEKHRMFLQILRVLLDEREHADIIQEAELTARGVSVVMGAESGKVRCSAQEAELLIRGVSVDKGAVSGTVRCSVQEAELLIRGVSVDKGAVSGTVRCSVQEAGLTMRGVSVDEGVESGAVMCSVEEVEKAGREQQERSLQMALNLARQLERLGQHLQHRFSNDVSEEMMRIIIGCLRAMEDVLAEVQASVQQMLLDRMEWWQEVSDCLREKTALLKQEAELMVKVTGQSVEQMRSDGQLEKQILSDFQTAVNEAVDQSADEVRGQAEALTLERVQKGSVRRRRMMKAQSCEWSHVSDSQTDARPMMKAFAELQARHWRQRRDFELQQDARITDALCERWTSLFGKCRGRLADLCSEFVFRSITVGSAPSEERCQSVLKSMKLTVTNQMQREERHSHAHLRRLREQLQQRRQVWLEDEALTRSCLDHFGEQQHAVVKATVSRHAGTLMSGALIEEQQHLLILELQRILTARCFYLRSVKEMKLTIQSDTQDSCVAIETVPADEAVIGQNLLHEQLSELEAVADMLQGHAHFLLGHALARGARLQISGVSVTDRQEKERLIDAVCESVHVTRDSVQSLIREYYCGIRSRSLTPHSSAAEKNDYTRALQTQLNNWARKPTSMELHHRVVELKRTCLTEFQKDLHCSVKTHNYRQLRDEEDAFMRRLASLARVSLRSQKDDFTAESSD